MTKTLFFFIILLPFSALSQSVISGKVFSNQNKKPVENASVFLSNTSVGSKTDKEGAYILQNATPGKYRLIVSILGFETYTQNITVTNGSDALPPIFISPKTIILKEVRIKQVSDADREKYYGWFVGEFLGTSPLAADCKILNPETLDFDYNDTTGVLTASAADFLQIENKALGYQVKYLLTNFTLNNLDKLSGKVHYEGSVLFAEMKGTAGQQRRWQRRREDVYEGSEMHFLRSALKNDLYREGFRVLRLLRYSNPDRPNDSLIEAKIKYYKNLKTQGSERRDSLKWWNKKLKLPKMIEKFMTSKKTKDTVMNRKDTSLFEVTTEAPLPLIKKDMIKPTNEHDLFALGFGNTRDALYITYSKKRHFYLDNDLTHLYYLSDPYNSQNTLIDFKAPYAFFDENGNVISPNSLTLSGVWGRDRVAELLPIDYVPVQNAATEENDFVADSVITKLDNYLTSNVAEKAYLQFDKPCYAAGDTMYFKAYIIQGERHKLSGISGVLHVDLINAQNKINQSIKLQIDSGVAWGDFALSDTLRKGNYRIRAYTQWMRNDGEKDFFDKIIPVASLNSNPIPNNKISQPSAQVILKPDMQFFPEGGNLVTGVTSKVAFKATGPNGMGVDVKGKINDNTGKQVAVFTSVHLGMGYFYLSPEPGKVYKAALTFANGQQDTIGLPVADANGITLSVNNAALPVASVSIKAGAAFYQENKDKEYALVIYSGGIATTVTCELDSPEINLDILKRRLHTGVATITLFTLDGEPLCERLFFVQNYDQLSISLSGEKSLFAKRGQSNIRFNVLNRAGYPAEGNFSVSVIDENKAPGRENKADNILSYFLLSSDLKGYVEQPGYYFASTNAETRGNLDILLLTQGYRRFEWRKVLDSNARPLAYQPEKGVEISGQIKNLFNKPIAKGTVTLISPKGGPVLSSISDDKGMFRFSNLVFMDTLHFVLSAVNAKGKNSTKIIYFNKPEGPVIYPDPQQAIHTFADTAIATLLSNDKLQQEEPVKDDHAKEIVLKQVNISEKKADDDYQTQSLAGAGNADQVMHADEVEKIQGPLVTSLAGRLRGVIFLGQPGQQVPILELNMRMGVGTNAPAKMLVVVDGVEGGDINVLNASDVETVEVLKNASASIYGMSGAGGVLIITTKQGGGESAKDIVAEGVLPISPMGFYKAREFYSPKYDHPNAPAGGQRDLRSTIYWNPEIKTGIDGNASFDYYNADGTGTYKLVIEGIDHDGNIGRQVYSYEVK